MAAPSSSAATAAADGEIGADGEAAALFMLPEAAPEAAAPAQEDEITIEQAPDSAVRDAGDTDTATPQAQSEDEAVPAPAAPRAAPTPESGGPATGGTNEEAAPEAPVTAEIPVDSPAEAPAVGNYNPATAGGTAVAIPDAGNVTLTLERTAVSLSELAEEGVALRGTLRNGSGVAVGWLPLYEVERWSNSAWATLSFRQAAIERGSAAWLDGVRIEPGESFAGDEFPLAASLFVEELVPGRYRIRKPFRADASNAEAVWLEAAAEFEIVAN